MLLLCDGNNLIVKYSGIIAFVGEELRYSSLLLAFSLDGMEYFRYDAF
jgi:hypothetical protein